MHFWNDDYDDDFNMYSQYLSVHIWGAQEFRFRPNGVFAKRRCAWHMRDQIYVLAFPFLY